jgi:hypothetical protein
MYLDAPDSTRFNVTLVDGSTETIDAADSYAHEQQMTVFYRSNNTRGAIDCWSTALASVRTADIQMVRRTPEFTDFGAPITSD